MKKCIYLIAMTMLIAGCQESPEKAASGLLSQAESAYAEGRYIDAKNLIDSIRTAYPKAFETRKAGIALQQKVELAEQEQTIRYQDSLIAQCQQQVEACKKRFVFEKDEKYQDLGLYTVASQAPEKNLGVNYLRGQVDEKGRMALISNWSGSAYIHHRSIKLIAGDNYIETPVSDDFHEFKDLGICYEKCNFTDGTDAGASDFITMHSSDAIKVELIGDKKTVSYQMSPADRKAISELRSLSLLLKTIEEAGQVRAEAERRIAFINSKIDGNETK